MRSNPIILRVSYGQYKFNWHFLRLWLLLLLLTLLLGSVQVLYKQVFPNSRPSPPKRAYIILERSLVVDIVVFVLVVVNVVVVPCLLSLITLYFVNKCYSEAPKGC